MLQPPSCTSHCSSRMLPVAAASCAGVALFEARGSAPSPSSLTRNCRQSRRPHLAAWCTGPAPWASVMPGERWPEEASSFRAARSPARAAWMVRWSTMPRCYQWVMAQAEQAPWSSFPSSKTPSHTHKVPHNNKKTLVYSLAPPEPGKRHSSGSQLASIAVGERGGGQSRWERKVMKDGWRRSTRGLLLSLWVAVTICWHMHTHTSLEMGELRQHGNLSNGRSPSQGMVDYNESHFLQLF